MSNFWWNIIEINFSLAVLWLAFRLVRPFLSFGKQRLILLLVPVFSVLPVLAKQTFSLNGVKLKLVELKAISVGPKAEATQTTPENWSLENIYWLTVSVAFAWLLFRLFRLLKLFLSAERKRGNGLIFTEIPGEESFSFFRWIQLKAGMDAESRMIVEQHEALHAKKRHTLDLFYTQIIQCFCWFNPAVYFLEQDLIHAHEFEVDQVMYQQHKTRYLEFLLAYTLGTSSPSYLLTHQFVTKLTLIKRIQIMKHTKKQRWAFALIIPALAGSLTLVSWASPAAKPAQKEAETVLEADKPAEFKGGTDALIKYIVNNVKYPESAAKNKVTGKVFVSFTVSEKGKISQAKVLRSIHPDLDAEAVRVVSAMPDWDPAEKGGKKISSEMQLPISFQL
ncbi:MAG: hypothetical protein K0R65_1041 [Crocinitomicaceae bacterium]|jgi:TonB family protein|nr:hypothetical protein [Crocinitomicaceae bacterium]